MCAKLNNCSKFNPFCGSKEKLNLLQENVFCSLIMVTEKKKAILTFGNFKRGNTYHNL